MRTRWIVLALLVGLLKDAHAFQEGTSSAPAPGPQVEYIGQACQTGPEHEWGFLIHLSTLPILHVARPSRYPLAWQPPSASRPRSWSSGPSRQLPVPNRCLDRYRR